MIQGKFEAKKDGLRQTQDGLWKITLTVHPDEDLGPMLSAAMGTRFMVAYAEIGDDEQPVQEPKQRSRTREAGILCNDLTFHEWLGGMGWIVNDDNDAAVVVRVKCEVDSRREFDTDPEAAARWDALKDRFEQETGRRAQRHG